jgi:hypothetical protein
MRLGHPQLKKPKQSSPGREKWKILGRQGGEDPMKGTRPQGHGTCSMGLVTGHPSMTLTTGEKLSLGHHHATKEEHLRHGRHPLETQLSVSRRGTPKEHTGALEYGMETSSLGDVMHHHARKGSSKMLGLPGRETTTLKEQQQRAPASQLMPLTGSILTSHGRSRMFSSVYGEVFDAWEQIPRNDAQSSPR